MANPDRDTVYTSDGSNRTVYTRESNSTGWFVGIVVALALLAIAYLVFTANSQPQTSVDVTTPPAATTTTPAVPAPTAPADNANTMSMAPADNGADTTAPADNNATTTTSTPAGDTTVSIAPEASSTPAPAQ